MNTRTLVDNLVNWLKEHGLAVGIIVVATLVALKVAAIANRRVMARLFRGKTDVESNKLAQTIGSAAHWVISLVIVGIAISMVLQQSGVNTQRVFEKGLEWLLSNGVGIAVIVAITFVALKVAALASARLAAISVRGSVDPEAQKRADTLSSVVRWVLRAGILAIAAVMILGQIGVQVGPIIAAAGVIGLAVGFGAQSLVQDVISGFFILLEDQVRVGDVVQLNDKSGLVEKITLRMVILRDFAGSVHYVRNGKIDVVTNMTKDFSFAVFDIGVAYREEVDEVIAEVKKIGAALQEDPNFKGDILAPLEVAGLDKFGDSAVVIKARMKTKPSKQWSVGREFNRRLKKRFDELGIDIPFPHITIFPGKDKRGDSPALKLEVTGRDQLLAGTGEKPGARPAAAD